MSIEVSAAGVATVDTAAEALQICDAENVTDVIIRDNHERIKMNKILRGFNLTPMSKP